MSKKTLYFFIPLSVLGLLVGSFYDLSISQSLCNQNSMYGVIFAGFGQTPCMFCYLASVALGIASFDKEKMRPSVLMLIFSVLDLIATALYFKDSYENMRNKILGSVILIAISLIFTVAVYFMADKSDKEKLRKLSLFLGLTPMLIFFSYEIIKQFRGRPRYRMIITRDDISFENWWNFASNVKSQFSSIIAKEEFKSFPSGHTASAAGTLLLPILGTVIAPIKRRENIVKIICCIFPVVVAFARIVSGAHFLSDVSVGLLDATVVIIIMRKVFGYDKAIKN